MTLETFESNPALKERFRVLSWEHYGGKNIVSSIEAYDLPIFATLFHPEAIFSPCEAYDILVCEANTSYAQSFSEALYREALKNQNAFESQQKLQALMAANQDFIRYSYSYQIHPLEGAEAIYCVREEYYF